MNKYTVSKLIIYPIKSMRGIELDSVQVENMGFANDRRWMLVDLQSQFLSQRKYPEMALLKIQLGRDLMKVTFTKNKNSMDIPIETDSANAFQVKIWNDSVNAHSVGAKYDKWFSRCLGTDCRLVKIDKVGRPVDAEFNPINSITGFSDGFPFLILGEESLNLLNSKLSAPVPVNRFRPNIVFSGGSPHDEDGWKQFRIGGVLFYGVKLCSRCVVTTIDQNSAEKGFEPLNTLKLYRNFNNKIMFGQNLIHEGNGIITVGDEINII